MVGNTGRTERSRSPRRVWKSHDETGGGRVLRSRNGPGSFPAGRAGRRVPGRGGERLHSSERPAGTPRRPAPPPYKRRRRGPQGRAPLPPPRSGPRPAPNRAARRRPWRPGPRGKGPPPPAPPKINPCHVTAAGQRAARGAAAAAAAGGGCRAAGRSHPPLPPAGRPVTAGQRRPRTAGREAKLAAARRCKALGARPPAAVPGCKPPTSAGSARCQSAFANTGVGWVRSSAARVAFCPAPLSRATPTPPGPSWAGSGTGPSRPSGPLRAQLGAAPPPGARPA